VKNIPNRPAACGYAVATGSCLWNRSSQFNQCRIAINAGIQNFDFFTPIARVDNSPALGATHGHKWQPNAADRPEKRAFTPTLVFKNVAVARRTIGYAQMVTPDKVAP
jgi:hypothetical protein